MSQLPPYGPPPSRPSLSQFTHSGITKTGSGRRKVWVIGLVILLVLAGGGAYALWGRTGNGPSPKTGGSGAAPGALAWSTAPSTAPSKNSRNAWGTWFTQTTVVKAEPDTVTSYDIRTGEKKWSLILPGTQCAASRDVDADRVLIALRYTDACDAMTVIDIRKGKALWTQPIVLLKADDPEMDSFRPDKWPAEMEVSVSQGHGLISWATGAHIVRLSDGQLIGDTGKQDACSDVGTAGGAQLLTQRFCGHRATIRAQNLKSLEKANWQWDGPENQTVSDILSTKPVVLLMSDADGKNIGKPTQLIVLGDTDGKERARIQLQHDHESSYCTSSMSRCAEYLVTGDTVYVAGKGSTTAYDLSNGRERWTFKADENRLALPVSADDGELSIYVAATPEREGKLIRVATRTGKEIRTADNTPDLRTTEWQLAHSKSAVPYLGDGRLLVVNEGLLESQDNDVIVAIGARTGQG
ncbi:PQQ-binding-like beta-propeller repeat protein [Streptomyces sp. NPDC001262]|uniref:outer membrane protein assembly factor BamB family protein n=1 Tax=unclassified Streptomyces TaxID=2593676 RepID=UPI00368067D0